MNISLTLPGAKVCKYFYLSTVKGLIDVLMNFAGREWHRGLPVGAGNSVQCSLLHVQADGESFGCCVYA